MLSKKRIYGRIILSIILTAIVGFLLYTSKDTHWGGGFWERWLAGRMQLDLSAAHQIVFWVRKSIHVTGYGTLTLLFWLYFYLWHLRGAKYLGVIATALVAAGDEYTQTLSSFRSGQPTDVLIDVSGGIIFTLLACWYLDCRSKAIGCVREPRKND